MPQTITSDNGKEFNNELIKNFSTELKIDGTLILIYYHHRVEPLLKDFAQLSYKIFT